MPAYFDLSLQFLRTDLYDGFIADFDAALERAGLTFWAGYWNAEGCTREEIAAWNQGKLTADFQLGCTEHCTHDYKQTLYRFAPYSHVRGFWMNRNPEEEVFTYFILFLEREVLMEEDGICFQRERVEELLELAGRLWQFSPVRSIQTGLEFSGGPVGLGALRAGEPPCAEAFAIVEPGCLIGPYRAVELTEGRSGRLLLEERHLIGPAVQGQLF